MLGINVARRLRKNMNTTITTSATEISSVRSTSFTEARIVVVRSSMIRNFAEAGIEACNSGIIATTRSTVAMMFAPGCRKMTITTAGLPFKLPALCVSCTESSTSETSLNRTGAPFW